MMPSLPPTTSRGRPWLQSNALRLAVLALLLGIAALWLQGCGGVHLAVIIGPTVEKPSMTDAGEVVQAIPTVRPRPTPRPSATRERPTPTSSPEPRPPAQSAPDRIIIPSIHLDAPVVTVGWSVKEKDGSWFSQWQAASYAAGFHESSALPGHVGNTVISGHHNIEGKVFEHLVDLQVGDIVTLYADNRPYHYQIKDKFILKEAGTSIEQRRQNAQWIAPTKDERLTLVTCWPPEGNTYRLIVIARPIDEF